MNIFIRYLLCVFAYTNLLLGSKEGLKSEKAALFLLKNNYGLCSSKIDLQNEETKKKILILQDLWENPKKEIDPKYSTLKKILPIIKTFKGLQHTYMEQSNNQQLYLDTTPFRYLLASLELGIHLDEPKAFLQQLIYYLYKKMTINKEPNYPEWKQRLNNCSITFPHLTWKYRQTMLFSDLTEYNTPIGTYRYNSVNFFHKKNTLLLPVDNNTYVTTFDTKTACMSDTSFMANQSMLKKPRKIPICWNRESAPKKTLLNGITFETKTEKKNTIINVYLNNKAITQLLCNSPCQISMNKKVFVCAPTVAKNKLPTLFGIHFPTKKYYQINGPVITDSKNYIPHVYLHKSLVFVSWPHDIDCINIVTGQHLRYHTKNDTKTMQIAPSGSQLVICEHQESKGIKTASAYIYHLFEAHRTPLSLDAYLHTALPVPTSFTSTLYTTIQMFFQKNPHFFEMNNVFMQETDIHT